MSGSSSSSSSSNCFRYPFTANQWQELETQAHIFKYMMSGLPVPPDLIFSVKRSLEYSNSSISSPHFPTQPMGWGYFQMGYGRKVDPEPGRCRRTDGKKWRCSKEAYPDSKYCEKHMHRGKNRSRKHVESITSSSSTSSSASQTLTPTSTTTQIPPPSSSNTGFSQSHILSNTLSASGNSGFSETSQQNPSYPFFMGYPSSSRKGNPGFVPSLTEENHSTTHHHQFINPGSSSSSSHSERNYRYLHGMREAIDERALFPGSSGSERSLPHLYNQSSSQFQDLSGYSSQHHLHQQEHNFALGTSFKSSNADNEEEKHKPLLHFFGK